MKGEARGGGERGSDAATFVPPAPTHRRLTPSKPRGYSRRDSRRLTPAFDPALTRLPPRDV
jgi:hypothetical protein